MQYELYHDESKVDGYWHGMLLVPVSTKALLVQYLKQIRSNIGYSHPLSLKEIKGKGKIFQCAEAWVLFAVGAMMAILKEPTYPIWLGEKEKGKPIPRSYQKDISHIIGIKFILFREKSSLKEMYDHLDYGSKIEITSGMGLKGGLHFLGSQEDPIQIIKMHFDGYEHHGGSVDHSRILKRLAGLRDYCEVLNSSFLIDDRTSKHNKVNPQCYDDCQLLQLTDLLIGSFRVALGYLTNNKDFHNKIADPVKYIVEKYKQGFARMKNSRWNKSFCMSQCYLEDGQWKFDTIEFKNKPHNEQLAFSFSG